MPRGDKSAYTDKQKRQAAHIAEGYEQRGVAEPEAEARAWKTVNKESGGGKKSGSGRAGRATAVEGQRDAAAKAPTKSRSDAARKGWETRRRKAAAH